MARLKLLMIAFVVTQFGIGQNFVQSNFVPPTCYGMCDGSVVFSTTTTAGPFTASLSNSSSCPNSTFQTSSGNTITLTHLCTCASNYSINFYNSSSILVGYELLQIPVTATAPLTLMTPTIQPAVCSSCCNGSVYVSWSGGNAPNPTDATVSIDGSSVGSAYFPNPAVCVGQHTLCVTDLDNCHVCTTFSMNFVSPAGLKENQIVTQISIFPNPSFDQIVVGSNNGEPINMVKCFDLAGKLILESGDKSGLQSRMNLDVSSLPPGVFLIEIRDKNNGTIGRQKFIKLLH